MLRNSVRGTQDLEAQRPTAWLEARNRVPGVKPIDNIDPFHNSREPNTYESFLNCGDDAFRTAAQTLADRMRQFGAASPEVKEWVAAQDTVFSNCPADGSIPAPPRPFSIASCPSRF